MKNDFYVYIYLDPRKTGVFKYGEYSFDNEPFYVGKGKLHRDKYHLFAADKIKGYYLYNKIRKIRKVKNQDPIIVRFKEDLNEKEAFHFEIDLINKIGRMDLKLGPLVNFTNGGDGASGRIIVFSDMHKQKISKANKNKKRSKQAKENYSNEMKNRWLDKEYRKKTSASISRTKNKTVNRQRQSNISKSLWEDNDYRQKVSSAIKLHFEENKEVRSQASKRNWENEEYRKKKINSFAREWEITQDGITFTIRNLKQWCEEHHLHYSICKNACYSNKLYKNIFFKRVTKCPES